MVTGYGNLMLQHSINTRTTVYARQQFQSTTGMWTVVGSQMNIDDSFPSAAEEDPDSRKLPAEIRTPPKNVDNGSGLVLRAQVPRSVDKDGPIIVAIL